MLENQKTIYDTLTDLKAAGAVTASAAATALDAYIDTGGGFTEGKLCVNVSAIKVNGGGTGSEKYVLTLQGSSTTTFTSYVNLACISLGTAGQMTAFGQNASLKTGMYIRPFTNMLGSTVYRYLRLYHTISGTVTTGINYSAWLAK